MRSWKTTLFGLLAAAGGGIAASMSAGVIDPTHFPAWIKDIAVMLGIVGTAGMGLAARDNDKSSEQVGAGTSGAGTSSGSSAKLAFLFAGILALGGVVGLAGCQATPSRVAYNSVMVPATTADLAMTAWGDYVKAYHPPISEELKVKAAFEHYQAAELVAISTARIYADFAASGNTNALLVRAQSTLTSQTATQALADLVNLLRGLGVKLPQ